MSFLSLPDSNLRCRVLNTKGHMRRRSSRSSGVSAPVLDTFLAATAVVHGMTLVTRNVRDCAHLDVPVLNPWLSAE